MGPPPIPAISATVRARDQGAERIGGDDPALGPGGDAACERMGGSTQTILIVLLSLLSGCVETFARKLSGGGRWVGRR